MAKEQIINQSISSELKKILTILTQDIAGIVGLATTYGLRDEAKELVDFYLSIQAMEFGQRDYDSRFLDSAQEKLATAQKAIKDMAHKDAADQIEHTRAQNDFLTSLLGNNDHEGESFISSDDN